MHIAQLLGAACIPHNCLFVYPQSFCLFGPIMIRSLIPFLALAHLVSVNTAWAENDASKRMESLRKMLAADPYDQAPLRKFREGIADTTNDDVQAHYQSISYLAAMSAGDWNMARVEYNRLKTNHPGSLYVERLAPDRMMGPCPVSRGRGFTEEICLVSRGTGLCQTCKGKGYFPGMKTDKRGRAEKNPCPTCTGTGRCQACEGRGRVKIVCRNCNGTGRVLSKKKGMIAYKHLLIFDIERVKKGRLAKPFGRKQGGKAELKADPDPS